MTTQQSFDNAMNCGDFYGATEFAEKLQDMADQEDKAAKERMAQRRNPTVTPTDELRKLVELLGEKPKEQTKNKELSFFDLV